LTREHIPPKTTGNKERNTSYRVEDWLKAQDIIQLPGGSIEQGGIFGYTLCSSCNRLTGRRYGTAYRVATTECMKVLDSLPHPGGLNRLDGPFGYPITLGESTPLRLGAFVRQVLSCMCSLSGPWDLAARHPSIRRNLLDGSTEALPPELALGFALYYGPRVRITGPQLCIDVTNQAWRWVIELAYPPFAFTLVLASNLSEPGLGLMMSD
jgi:hypothetical protein